MTRLFVTLQAETAKVYRANGRRYLTLKAACRAEARRIYIESCVGWGARPEDLWPEYAEKIERVAEALRRRVRRRERQEK